MANKLCHTPIGNGLAFGILQVANLLNRLIQSPQYTMNFLLASNKGGFVTQLTDLRWFPMGTFEDSVWSHSGTKVVMDNGKGLVTIIDMARFLRRDMSVTYISESQYGFA